MVYSEFFLKESRKKLHILSIFALMSVLMGGLFLVRQTAEKNGWQQIQGIEKMYIVNRTPHSFDVVWSSKPDSTYKQWIEVGTRKGTYPLKTQAERYEGFQYASVKGLSEKTTYYFRIRAGTKTFILPSLNSDSVTTPQKRSEKPISPAYGRVLLPNNKPYVNRVLIYELDGFYPLAVFTKSTGEWLLPLTGIVGKKGNSVSSVADTTPVTLRLFSIPNGVVRTVMNQTRPLKQAIIAGTSVRLAAQNTLKKSENVLGASSQTSLSGSPINNVSQIIYPKENALIPGNSPLIRGVAPSGKDVIVLIQGGGKQYSYRTVADDKGDWMVQAPVALPFGRYTILVTIQNGSGATTIVKRVFSIIKSGEQVLGDATSSPTVVPTATPTNTSPTIAPTSSVVPTASPPTIAPTVNAYPTSILPTRLVPTASPPVSGGGMSSYLFGALLFIVIGAGLVLAF